MVTVRAKGHVYRYAWRGGPRLLAEPGTAEFLIELGDAHRSRMTGDRESFAGLCALYRASPAWTDLAASTRVNWAPWVDRAQAKFGRQAVAMFDDPGAAPVIRRWRDQWRSTPRSADTALQVLSRLLSFAAEEGLVATNACRNVPRLYRVDRSDIIWTDDDLAALAAKASPEVMAAVRLALATGLRQGDLLRLAWSHVGERAIETRTRKTARRGRPGRRATIPLHAELAQTLAAIPRRSPTILTSSTGRPWTSDGFRSSFRAAAQAAGVDKHFHDLRGTSATRLYRAGFSVREIAEVMAWSEAQVGQMIDRYVKRDELLADRIRRLDATLARNDSGT